MQHPQRQSTASARSGDLRGCLRQAQFLPFIKRTSIRRILLVGSLGTLLSYCFIQSPAQAIKVYDWEQIHMDEDNGQNATDLHFVLWQKEANISILGWDYRLQKRRSEGGGLITEGEGITGLSPDCPFRTSKHLPCNDLNHAATVDINNLDIPFSTRLWLRTSLELSDWNTLRKRELKWTFDQNPNPQPPANAGLPPEEGFVFSNYTNDTANPGKYKVTYTVSNDDTTRWFRVETLKFLLDSNNTPINEPETMLGWPGYVPYGTFVLAPGEERNITLDNLYMRQWLYATFVKQEIAGLDGANLGDPSPTIQIHETPAPLPVVGIVAAFKLSRKLRKRIKSSSVS